MIKDVLTPGSAPDPTAIDGAPVARFDRDADGTPDAFELSGYLGLSLFDDFDSQNPGVPDGTDPSGFTLVQDTDGDGFLDWYEVAIGNSTNPNDPLDTPFLADVEVNGAVDLGDAVRSLQVINGTVAALSAGTNPHAINVSGTTEFSLNNPLQILRFQNGSRLYLPGLVGVP